MGYVHSPWQTTPCVTILFVLPVRTITRQEYHHWLVPIVSNSETGGVKLPSVLRPLGADTCLSSMISSRYLPSPLGVPLSILSFIWSNSIRDLVITGFWDYLRLILNSNLTVLLFKCVKTSQRWNNVSSKLILHLDVKPCFGYPSNFEIRVALYVVRTFSFK